MKETLEQQEKELYKYRMKAIINNINSIINNINLIEKNIAEINKEIIIIKINLFEELKK